MSLVASIHYVLRNPTNPFRIVSKTRIQYPVALDIFLRMQWMDFISLTQKVRLSGAARSVAEQYNGKEGELEITPLSLKGRSKRWKQIQIAGHVSRVSQDFLCLWRLCKVANEIEVVSSKFSMVDLRPTSPMKPKRTSGVWGTQARAWDKSDGHDPSLRTHEPLESCKSCCSVALKIFAPLGRCRYLKIKSTSDIAC